MSDLLGLQDAVKSEFKDAQTGVILAKNPNAASFLDVVLKDYELSVEWSSNRKFGLTSRTDLVYGELMDEYLATYDDTLRRVFELLRSKAVTFKQDVVHSI